jgi:hypothetical protein
MMQSQQNAREGQDEKSKNIASFPTHVLLAIAAGVKLRSVRTCDLEKVIKHVVPKRNLRFCEIEKYAMQVLRHHVHEQLPFLKDATIQSGESEDQFVSYYEGLYGRTLAIKGGSGAFLLAD